jgi:hypothetical protein
MKPFILVAAVAAFELAFLASVATPPSEAAAVGAPGQHALAQRAGEPAPCTPPG